MTVKELIKILLEADMDAGVYIEDSNGYSYSFNVRIDEDVFLCEEED